MDDPDKSSNSTDEGHVNEEPENESNDSHKKEPEKKFKKQEQMHLMFRDAPSTLAELRNKDKTELHFAGVTGLLLVVSYVLLIFQYWTVLGIAITIYLVYAIPLIKEHKSEYLSDKVEEMIAKKSDEEIIEQERD